MLPRNMEISASQYEVAEDRIMANGYGQKEARWIFSEHEAERYAITRKMYMPAWYSAA